MKMFLYIGKSKSNKEIHYFLKICVFFYHYSQAGVSRSATIVVAYVMTIGDYDVEKALQIVKGARGYVQPNPGFLSQLRRYYTNDVKKVYYFRKMIYLYIFLFALELVSFDATLSYLYI